MTTITAGGGIEEYLSDIKPQPQYSDIYGDVFYRVGCVKMAAPRHERFEFILNMGYASIDRVFGNKPLSGSLTFVFPERFMSVHEQQAFVSVIHKHKDIDKIKQIDILTSSPLLIGNFHREQIRILTWEDDSKHDGCIYDGSTSYGSE